MPGQQFEYGFDDIGNRLSTKGGGDQNGANLQSATYSVNSLNQYTSRTVPGVVPVLGLATPAATVSLSLNGGAASAVTYRKGEYFWKETAVPNTSVAYPSFNVTAVNGGSSATPVSGNVFVPKTPEVYDDLATASVNEGYDLDGNQLRDGRWTYTWDAENRLIKMDPINGLPAGADWRFRFGYDAKGRRITKTAEQWVGGAWVMKVNSRFVYDGWNLLAELTSANAVIRTYVWGSDLSGSLQGAGGVGGLLEVNDTSNGAHFVSHDGNGNVGALVSVTGGATTASYEYGPFGELIRSTGSLAKNNPFRFSTKYQDNETDLLYYGYRYYSQSAGRWLSRDPVHELGGLNVYAFVNNRSSGRIDYLGLCKLGEKRNAKCEPKVKHWATTPDYDEAIDDFFKLIDNVTAISDIAQICLNGAIAPSALLEAISEYLTGKSLDVGAGDVYDLAKNASEKGHAAIGGFKLWTRIRYEQCGCGLLWGTTWSKNKTEWKQFTTRTSNNNNEAIYEIKLGGYADADTACKAHLAEFNK